MVNKLFIDASLNYLDLIYIKDEQIISFKKIKQEKNLTKILNPSIMDFLKENNLSMKDINEIYTVNGPGSFTSIKLTAILINLWKYYYDVDLYIINTCLWNTLDDDLIAIDAKSQLFYIFKDNKENMLNVQLLNKQEVLELANNINKKIKWEVNENQLVEKWNKNKNNFIKVESIVPNYVKSAI